MSETANPVRLVAIDDDPAALELVAEALAWPGLEIHTAAGAAEGLALVESKHPEIVLLDLVMPGMGGMEVLDRIQAAAPGTDVILITGDYSTDSAVEAIRRGASDYLTKPLSIPLLRERVGKIVEEARRRQSALDIEAELLKASAFEEMIGRSPAMLEVFARIRRVAPHYRTVLITGPTGSGKELAARALHRLSPASAERFAVCNCSAVVETLFESELFGYVKGAFTGAVQDKIGHFEYAHGGTLFLDEIGEMPLATQAKLLRVLQSGEIQRVGSPAVRRVDVRVVAATNRDLRKQIAEGRFRSDLFYRLAMVEIRLPSLAERREDLPLLERHFLARCSAQYNKPVRGMTRRAQGLLARYSWPGNVRELENVLGSACMIATSDLLDIRDLPEYLLNQPSPVEEDEILTLAGVERHHVARVLALMGGNKLRAAEALGISRATLYRILGEQAASAQ